MEAKILLLGASAVGAEAIKNLVLPGVGHVTVADGGNVTAADARTNFFVTAASVGSPRAPVVLATLLELNPDVRGSALVEPLADTLARGADFFRGFTLILGTQLTDSEAGAVEAVAGGVPLVLARSYGLLGTVRSAVTEHRIVESKPMGVVRDLRIATPFPRLRAAADAVDMAAIDDLTYVHVPFPLLLIKALDAWRAAHGGAAPKTSAEKAAERAGVQAELQAMVAARRAVTEKSRVNFDEALAVASNAGVPARIPDDCADVLADDAAHAGLTAASAPFWFIVRALSDFVAAHGALPLPGDLPDMTATTELYIALQRAYEAQAAEEAAEVAAQVAALVAEVHAPADTVPAADIAYACKHAQFLRVIRMHSVAGELAWDATTVEGVQEALAEVREDAQAPILWYLALRGAYAVAAATGRLPGSGAADKPDDLAADARRVHAAITDALAAAGIDAALAARVTLDHATEVVRYGGAELHTTAALLGGIASQEAIKLLTAQFTPANNTFVYNGIAGVSTTLRL